MFKAIMEIDSEAKGKENRNEWINQVAGAGQFSVSSCKGQVGPY